MCIRCFFYIKIYLFWRGGAEGEAEGGFSSRLPDDREPDNDDVGLDLRTLRT